MDGKVGLPHPGSGTVTVEGGDVMTLYTHMQTDGVFGLKVEGGQTVKAGDIIGYIGSTLTNGPHLHYEILVRKTAETANSPGGAFNIEGWASVNPLVYTERAANNPNLSLQSYQMELKNPAFEGLLTRQQRAIISNFPQQSNTLFQIFGKTNKTPPKY